MYFPNENNESLFPLDNVGYMDWTTTPLLLSSIRLVLQGYKNTTPI